MKTLSIIPVALALICCSFSNPEINPVKSKTAITKPASGECFSFFRTHRQGKGITSTWGLLNNNNVTEFVVQQTYEDPTDPYANWADLTPTVTCNNGRSFKFTDENVFPGFISYRVVAMNGLSVVDISEVSTEHIVKH